MALAGWVIFQAILLSAFATIMTISRNMQIYTLPSICRSILRKIFIFSKKIFVAFVAAMNCCDARLSLPLSCLPSIFNDNLSCFALMQMSHLELSRAIICRSIKHVHVCNEAFTLKLMIENYPMWKSCFKWINAVGNGDHSNAHKCQTHVWSCAKWEEYVHITCIQNVIILCRRSEEAAKCKK